MSDHEFNQSQELGHEPITVSARAISSAFVVLFATIIAALLLVAGLSSYLATVWRGEATVGSAGTPIAPPPGVPAVAANQFDTLRQLRSLEQNLLTEYAWVDRDTGVARIPVERAMEILSQQPAPTPETQDEAADEKLAAE
jgi:hypothetical protein